MASKGGKEKLHAPFMDVEKEREIRYIVFTIRPMWV